MGKQGEERYCKKEETREGISSSETSDLFGRQAFLVLHGEAIAMLAGRVVECSTLQTGIMELTVRSILINVIPVWFISADGFEFAQRGIVIVTWEKFRKDDA